MPPMTPSLARIARIAVAGCVIAVAAGCQGSQTSTAPTGSVATLGPSAGLGASGVPGASQPIVTGSRPISMTLLPNWTKVELTDAGLRAVLTSVATSNPLLAKTLTDLLQSGAYLHFALYAIGYDGGLYIGNVNVSEAPVPGLDLDGLGPVLESQLTSLGASNLVTTHVALPAGPGLRLTYTLTVSPGSGAPVTVDGRLFVFIVDSVTYDVTFSCGGPDPSACLAQADQMIQTFHIGS
jgi:hypothetical protein